jgi:hypothetical protein
MCLLTVGLVLPAHARLGETEDQLTARYGKGSVPWQSTPEYPVSVQMFYKNGTTITVRLIDGISVGETYQQDSGATEKEMDALLTANAQGHTWKQKKTKAAASDEPISKIWFRDDGAFAFYKIPFVFIIKSKQLDDADKAQAVATKKAGLTSLKDF